MFDHSPLSEGAGGRGGDIFTTAAGAPPRFSSGERGRLLLQTTRPCSNGAEPRGGYEQAFFCFARGPGEEERREDGRGAVEL
jgi:hypothetical protein